MNPYMNADTLKTVIASIPQPAKDILWIIACAIGILVLVIGGGVLLKQTFVTSKDSEYKEDDKQYYEVVKCDLCNRKMKDYRFATVILQRFQQSRAHSGNSVTLEVRQGNLCEVCEQNFIDNTSMALGCTVNYKKFNGKE